MNATAKTSAKVHWYDNPKNQPPPLADDLQRNTGRVQRQKKTPAAHKTTIRDVEKKLNKKYSGTTIEFSHFTKGKAHPVFSITITISGQIKTFSVTGSGSPGTHRYIDNIAKEIRKIASGFNN